MVGLGEEIVLNLSMIIMLNFPTLITDSSLYSTSNHVNDLLSLNVFVNLQQLILEHLGHDAFESLEEGTDDDVHRDATNSDILVLETNGQVRVEHDYKFDTHKITDAIEANLGLKVEFLFSLTSEISCFI